MKQRLLFLLQLVLSCLPLSASLVPWDDGALHFNERDIEGIPSLELNGTAGNVYFPVYLARGAANVFLDQGRTLIGVRGGLLTFDADLDKYEGTTRSGWGNVVVSSPSFSATLLGGTILFPDDMHILKHKPRFVLEDGSFDLFHASIAYRASRNFGISAAGLYLDGAFESGDLYYFYGKPTDLETYGGSVALHGPWRTSFLAFGGRLHGTITTEEDKELGAEGGKAFGWIVRKAFGSETDVHHGSLFVGYGYGAFDAEVAATPETQTYFFFPYRKFSGDADVHVHCILGGMSFSRDGKRFGYGIDLMGLFCFNEDLQADFDYTYKQLWPWDGSRHWGGARLKEGSHTGLLIGKAYASYQLPVISRFSIKLTFVKYFGATLLRYHGLPSEGQESGQDDDSPSFHQIFTWNTLYEIAVRGTFVGMTIAF